jgi:hypothetical protein
MPRVVEHLKYFSAQSLNGASWEAHIFYKKPGHNLVLFRLFANPDEKEAKRAVVVRLFISHQPLE